MVCVRRGREVDVHARRRSRNERRVENGIANRIEGRHDGDI